MGKRNRKKYTIDERGMYRQQSFQKFINPATTTKWAPKFDKLKIIQQIKYLEIQISVANGSIELIIIIILLVIRFKTITNSIK